MNWEALIVALVFAVMGSFVIPLLRNYIKNKNVMALIEVAVAATEQWYQNNLKDGVKPTPELKKGKSIEIFNAMAGSHKLDADAVSALIEAAVNKMNNGK